MNKTYDVEASALLPADTTCPPHFRPILGAVKHYGCGYVMVLQDVGPFVNPISSDVPTIIVVGDDLDVAKGPAAFDTASLLPVIRACEAAFVIASDAEQQTYFQACMVPALGRKNVMIVETLPAHEEAWVALIEKAKPDIRMTVSKVDPNPQTWGHA